MLGTIAPPEAPVELHVKNSALVGNRQRPFMVVPVTEDGFKALHASIAPPKLHSILLALHPVPEQLVPAVGAASQQLSAPAQPFVVQLELLFPLFAVVPVPGTLLLHKETRRVSVPVWMFAAPQSGSGGVG